MLDLLPLVIGREFGKGTMCHSMGLDRNAAGFQASEFVPAADAFDRFVVQIKRVGTTDIVRRHENDGRISEPLQARESDSSHRLGPVIKRKEDRALMQ